MDKNLNVLVIPSWYPNGTDKLMGKYHMDFCSALADDGRMKVAMLYVYRQLLSKPLRYLTMKKEDVHQERGYKVYERRSLNMASISFDLQMKNYSAAVLKEYRSYEKENGKPDIIHAQVSVPAGYAACVLGKKIGVPVMLTEHATYFERFFTGDEEKYNRYTLDNSTITCVGDYMREIYAQKGYTARTLPNIVDCSMFEPRGSRCARRDEINIVSVCAFRDVKKLDDVMGAVKLIKESGRKIKYTMVGDGDYADFYHGKAAELGLEDETVFTGRKTGTEVAAILPEFDALVIASEIETFGIPAIEALASGIPVISTRCRGTEGIITDSCGVFCDVGDIQGIAAGILRVVDNPHLYTQENCRKRAMDFDAKAVAQRAYDMYVECIEKNKVSTAQ